MQTESEYSNASGATGGSVRGFDAETARRASLEATLSRVRFTRRARKAAGAAAALLIAGAIAKVVIPTGAGGPEDGQPLRQQVNANAAGDLIVRSAPLRPEQKVISTPLPGLVFATPATVETPRVIKSTTPPVERITDAEFQHVLAANALCWIQINGQPAQVISARH